MPYNIPAGQQTGTADFAEGQEPGSDASQVDPSGEIRADTGPEDTELEGIVKSVEHSRFELPLKGANDGLRVDVIVPYVPPQSLCYGPLLAISAAKAAT